ncbi:MAG: hypothetical protein ABJN26_06165 [Stappiaceae bacterium]
MTAQTKIIDENEASPDRDDFSKQLDSIEYKAGTLKGLIDMASRRHLEGKFTDVLNLLYASQEICSLLTDQAENACNTDWVARWPKPKF